MGVLKHFKSTEFKIFLTLFIIYSFFASWMGYWENSTFFLAQSIVDKGILSIDDFANQTTDRSIYENHFYSDKNPGLSFLLVPVYSISKFFIGPVTQPTGPYLTYKEVSSEIYTFINLSLSTNLNRIISIILGSSLFASLNVVLIYKISSFFTRKIRVRLLITFFAGIATPIMYFGTMLYDVSISTFFILLSFLLFFDLRANSFKHKWKLILLGAVWGYSIVITPLNGVLLLLLFPISLFYMKKKFIFPIVGFLIGISPLILYNSIAFGNVFTIAKNYSDLAANQPLPIKFPILGLYFLALKIFFGVSTGLLILYPIFFLCIFGFVKMWGKYKLELAMFILPIILVIILTPLFFSSPFGGITFVYKNPFPFFVPFIFLLIFPFDFLLDGKKLKFVLYFLIIYSITVAFIPLAGLLNYEGIFPLTDYYFPNFLNAGPRSRILETLVLGGNFDIRFLTFSDREQFPYLHATSYPPFITLFFAAFIFSIVWIKNMKFKIGLSLLIAFGALIYFIFWPTIFESNKTGVIFEDGFYSKLSNEEGVWMNNQGKMVIKNSQRVAPTSLDLKFGTFFEDKHLDIYLNGRFIDQILIKNNSSNEFLINLDKNTTRNLIFLKTKEPCKMPGTMPDLNMDDTRCLNIFVSIYSKLM